MSPFTTDRLFRPWKHRHTVALTFALACLWAAACDAAAMVPAHEPVLQVDVPFPTADKPQSKLWHAAGRWWALLPRTSGPSLWERSATGWKEHQDIARSLQGTPGRADVWADRDGATAVTVGDRQLAIVRLTPQTAGGNPTWSAAELARLAAPASDVFETATLARDDQGRWWVAAVVQGKVYVWNSADARTWSSPISLGSGLHVDDLCVITPNPAGVSVIWSNQRTDAVFTREHLGSAPPESWSPVITIDRGGKTADDHLNAALAPDGRLWLATKNSVDRESEPQLVLRIRSLDGTWQNLPYAPVIDGHAPSRPAVFATPDPMRVLLAHSVYDADDPTRDRIVVGLADPASSAVLVDPVNVIVPAPALRSRANDITGPRAPFPAGEPWIILASDGEGRVYESDLSLLSRARSDK